LRCVGAAFRLEGRDLAPVAGRVGIGDVFRHMLQALGLASHAACRDAEGGTEIRHIDPPL
jgi:hypothetical protein